MCLVRSTQGELIVAGQRTEEKNAAHGAEVPALTHGRTRPCPYCRGLAAALALAARTGDLRLAQGRSACDAAPVNEIIFEVREDETDGGYVAIALGNAIATQGDSVE